MKAIVKLGFVPLVDCAIPVVAAEKGFAQAEGIDLVLERANSWATLRDKLAFGLIDAAHILAPLPLAMALGIAGIPRARTIVPMALGLGNNAITLSNALYQRMEQAAPDVMAGPPALRARALRPLIDADRVAGKLPLSFATVFPFSCHHYELRAWLAAGGIDSASEVNLGVIAPPRMVESLASGWIDGFCVGEPWNHRAMQKGVGTVVVAKTDIWPDGLEKVLGIRADWAGDNADGVSALIRALARATAWAVDPANRAELAALLAEPHFVGLDAGLIEQCLTGAMPAPDQGRPRAADARRLLAEMALAGQVALPLDGADILVAEVWRGDLYDIAVG